MHTPAYTLSYLENAMASATMSSLIKILKQYQSLGIDLGRALIIVTFTYEAINEAEHSLMHRAFINVSFLSMVNDDSDPSI